MSYILNEAVLTLLVERPGYPYEVSRRFPRRYGDVLAPRPQSVFDAWPRLMSIGLIEPMLVGDMSMSDRPRPYQVTNGGAQVRNDWLLAPLPSDLLEARRVFRVRVMSVLQCDQGVLSALVDRYESGVVAAMARPQDPERSLAADLLRDRRATWCDAQLRWVSDLRDRLGNCGTLW